MRIGRILISLAFLGNVCSLWSSNIVYPWRSTTAIVKSGETFEVWFNADNGQSVKSVELQGPYNEVPVKIRSQSGNWVYDVISGNSFNTKISVKVPASTPADRYDIVLKTSEGNIVSTGGVKVIKKYQQVFYILHFSDLHAFQRGSETVLQRLSTIADIANIIHPELVFNTGDNLYRPTDERMNQLFGGDNKLNTKGISSFNAATFTVVGNHDYDFDKSENKGFYKEKAEWWNKWWGLQNYNFKYGKGRFMAINNGWEGFKPAYQYKEIAKWFKKADKGNLRIGLAHIRNKEMELFDSLAKPGLILVGHNHYIANQNPSLLNDKPIQYIVNSVRDNMEFNLFKVDLKKGIYTPVGSKTAQIVYVENPDDSKSPELYKPKLTIAFLNPNNGSSISNTATIVNKLPFAIEDAHIRFIMPKGKKYTVSPGKIEQQFDGTNFHVVDAIVDLEANSSTSVEIK